MELLGPRLKLRKFSFQEFDLNFLFEWRNCNNFIANCTNRRFKINFSNFVRELENDFGKDRHVQFMIEKIIGGNIIGTIYSYNFQSVDGYAFITLFINPENQTRGYGPEALALFIDYLFKSHHLQKVYLEVYSYNHLSISPLIKSGFHLEGHFKNHRFFEGRRYDLFRFSLYIEELIEIENFLTKLKKGGKNE
jgi:RimJ/RimL family protein N-acetyltransferase